LSENPKF